MILVTTAGKVGSEAARQLAKSGEQVRVLVRSPEKASALAHAGADVFDGDLEVPASVDEAMHGISPVILVTAPVVHQELNVIDSAVRAALLPAGGDAIAGQAGGASASAPISFALRDDVCVNRASPARAAQHLLAFDGTRADTDFERNNDRSPLVPTPATAAS